MALVFLGLSDELLSPLLRMPKTERTRQKTDDDDDHHLGEHFGVPAHVMGAVDSPLVVPSLKRASDDGLALEIRPLQPSQPVRSAQVTARGR